MSKIKLQGAHKNTTTMSNMDTIRTEEGLQ